MKVVLQMYFAFAIAVQQSLVMSWWPFSSESSHAEADNEQGRALQNSPVPFEMTDAEEKFLAEAKQYMSNLSPLDSCHHIVINRIKKSCSDVNEEELGKLGVALLNCQSKAEGRPTYTCKEDMTLAQCTSGMDASMWNSYHIISNRARAICYATRQQQFRHKTEYTVNQLAKQAGRQMHLLKDLENGQTKLVDTASETVNKITAGQEELLTQQRSLKQTYEDVQQTMSLTLRSNMRALNEEKTLISQGKKQLSEMTRVLGDKLENATAEIYRQDKDRKKSQRQIFDDLSNIRKKAQDVWNKIDVSTSQMASYHTQASQHYIETLENLEKMNNTINYLIKVINDTQARVDSRLSWFASQFGGTGDKLAILTSTVMHVSYFLLATFGILFLNAPLFTRLSLLILVPVNAWCEIKLGRCLSWTSLTILVVATLAANWIFLYVKFKLDDRNPKELQGQTYALCEAETIPVSPIKSSRRSSFWKSTPRERDSGVISPSSMPLHNSTFDDSSKLSLDVRDNSTINSEVKNGAKRQLNLSIPESFASNSTLSSRTTSRRRCSAFTKTGSACKRNVLNGSLTCSSHRK